MRALVVVLKALAVVAMLIGVGHLTMGLQSEVLLGARLPAEIIAAPVLDSQNRFYGVVFMGNGALVWLCARDVARHAALLRTVATFIFLGGFGRLVSIALTGLPTPQVIVLIAIELLGMPLLLWWHLRVLRRQPIGAVAPAAKIA